MPRDEQLVEVIVRPRRVLWHGGGVHYPGARVRVTEDEYAALTARRIVSIATDENASAIDDAVARRLPIPGYVRAEHADPNADPADPADVGRRASNARQRAETKPERPAATRRRSRARPAE